jgi:ribonucleoside-diphosphate reductase alpha chain
LDKHPLYEPKGLAEEIFKKRYAIHEHETFHEACDRVAYHVSQAESGENITKWRTLFSEILKKNLFFPGGRIMYGSGRPKGNLLNCYVLPTGDSREGWGKTVSDMIVVSGTGGGLGVNGSPIRPRGTPINGTGGRATGAVSLFAIMNAAGEVIRAGGGRRTALMLALEHDHGDILEFLEKIQRISLLKSKKARNTSLDTMGKSLESLILKKYGIKSLEIPCILVSQDF